jgi:hypothetical protein
MSVRLRLGATAVASFAVLGITLAGCSSDGVKPSAKGPNPAATGAAAKTPDSKSEASKDKDQPKAPSGDAAAFCTALQSFDEFDDLEEGEKLSADQQKRALAQIDLLIKTAPGEIRDAVKTFMDPMRAVIKSGKIPDLDVADLDKMPQELQKAFEKFFGYAMANCADLGSDTGGTGDAEDTDDTESSDS